MYPEAVEQALNEIVDSLKETRFFKEQVCDPKYIREEFGKVLFKQWMQDGEFAITMQQAEYLIQRALVSQSIDRLVDVGILGTIEDENGEEVVYLTDLGKTISFQLEELPEMQSAILEHEVKLEKTKPKPTTCNGKVVEIEGVKYQLTELK